MLKRISAMDLRDYVNRRLTTKDIANMYGVSPVYVTRVLPKRAYSNQKVYKAQLRATREEYRNGLAQQVIDKKMAVEEAARCAGCSVRTMFRHISKVRSNA